MAGINMFILLCVVSLTFASENESKNNFISRLRTKRRALFGSYNPYNNIQDSYYPKYRTSEDLFQGPRNRFFRRKPSSWGSPGSYDRKPDYPRSYPDQPSWPGVDRKENSKEDVDILQPSDFPDSRVPVSRSNSPLCGRARLIVKSEKIVGGVSVTIGEHPWMALIQYRGRNRIINGCGATLISSRYVLTAAHCVEEKYLRQRRLQVHRVVLGEHDTTKDLDCVTSPSRTCADFPRVYTPSQIIKHEEFDTVNALNDIALIRLNREVQFSEYIQPICLPDKDFIYKEDDLVTVLGWGRVATEGDNSPVLLKATLPLVNKEQCNTHGVSLNDGQMCLGLGDGVDTCTGDSGGPMLMQRRKNFEPVTYQVGIISYGFASRGCGTAPSVNTYLPYYLDWIYSKIGD